MLGHFMSFCFYVYMYYMYIYIYLCVCSSSKSNDIHSCAIAGPFNSLLGCDLAMKEIVGFRNQLEALRQEESTVLQGLSFFKIEQPPFRAIKILEKVFILYPN